MSNIFFRHDAHAKDDEKVVALRCKFGDEGYAYYFMCLEIMCEDDKHIICLSKCTIIARRLHIQMDNLMDFLEYCVEIDLFAKDKSGYWSPRFKEEMDKIDGIRAKRSQASNSYWHPEPTPEPVKIEKPKKEKVKPDPDIAETPETPELKKLVNSIIAPYLASKEGKASNHKSTLTNQNYADLIGKYGVSKLKKMLVVYYDWKMTTDKTCKDDNLRMYKKWVSENADKPTIRQTANTNYVQPLKDKAGF
jgi:hypothetical protein